MKKHIKHVRRHARKHHQNHVDLKNLLHLPIWREKILELFLGTFILTILTILIFLNWGRIVGALTPNPAPTPPEINTVGFDQGVLGVYRISQQSLEEKEHLIDSIATAGYARGIQGNLLANESRINAQETLEENVSAFEASLFVTADLSRGQHLTALQEDEGQSLQKSILSTYYLGQKTVTVDHTLNLDSKLLSQIYNALPNDSPESFDLFQFLNQALNRADQLEGYLNLLMALEDQTRQRIADLSSTVAFLESNLEAQETRVELTEAQFFSELDAFSGSDAEESLQEFIGLQSGQTEIRAKLGAYQRLLDYYNFYLPNLEIMIEAVQENWDALIAGVRVTEIEGMRLNLIIRP